MGVIQRQGIKNSIISYLAVAIGAVNRFFIYPATLTTEELGLITYLMDTAFMIAPFLMLGANSISVRFFPVFQNKENGHNGLLVIATLMCLVGFGIFAVLFFPFKSELFASRGGNVFLQQYTYAILPLTFCLVFMMSFTNYIANFHRIAVPQGIMYLTKITVPVLAILYFFQVFSLDVLVWGIVVSYFLMLALILWYLYLLGELQFQPNFSFVNKKLAKEMATYAFYGILGGIGSAFVTRIDIYMITSLTTLANAGVYSIPLMMAGVIEIPTKAINNISSPIIANAWRNEDTAEIHSIYKKSSLTLLVVGVLIFTAAWACIDNLFALIPNREEYILGKYVFFWLGLGKLFDMATGINNHIVGYSKYFRFNFQAVILLGIATILTNLWLIPKLGIVGAALASALSLAAYNIAKLIFIQIQFNMQPFSWNSVWIILAGLVAYFLAVLVPPFGDTVLLNLLHILVRATIVLIVFGGAVLYFNLSSDITKAVWQGVDMLRQRLKK